MCGTRGQGAEGFPLKYTTQPDCCQRGWLQRPAAPGDHVLRCSCPMWEQGCWDELPSPVRGGCRLGPGGCPPRNHPPCCPRAGRIAAPVLAQLLQMINLLISTGPANPKQGREISEQAPGSVHGIPGQSPC